MNKHVGLADARARETALRPDASFIVQAPAGSGKTGLLSQRYLRLLASVSHPEEIVAITFTRKAASEMRERILHALVMARDEPAPGSAHDQLTWQLARAVLDQDRERNWKLLDCPGRLRIQTIDSLCMELARQMPLLTGFGVVPGITEDAGRLYREAAAAMLMELESGDEWADDLALLLGHLDNQMDKLQGLIAAMLARRDHWLRHMVEQDHPRLMRHEIEQVLSGIVEQALAEIVSSLPEQPGQDIPGLVRFAAANLPEHHPLRACVDMRELPGASVNELAQWLGLRSLLLIKDGAWRKPTAINKKTGFPAEKDAPDETLKAVYRQMKQDMQSLLDTLANNDALRASLLKLDKLPDPVYADGQWQIIDALFRILLRSAAHLTLVFSEHGKIDFAEMALRAKQALGDEDSPTNLALKLDYQIRHLLVDEFQDTSQNQSDLFHRLTAGWEAGDGRTLFLVGDPMQSIYRFREAEVGLFIDAWQGRLGQVALEPLSLSSNFRSQQGIIDWVNQHFTDILPAHSDKVSGAVSYAASSPVKPSEPGQAVSVHPFIGRDDQAEAQQVTTLVNHARQQDPAGTIAVLVRSRSHLVEIISELKNAKLAFRAVEIEHLAQRPVIQDLLALSCALIHPGDRIHWLALLRTPFCGLSLKDLHALTGDNREDFRSTLIDLLHHTDRIERMSETGRAQLERILPVLDAVLAERDRRPLRAWVETAWIALGGPATVEDETDLEDTGVFFQLLEGLHDSGEIIEPETVLEQLVRLYALPDVTAGESLQLMTIHKAKGLEFDTVIMPGLGKQQRPDDVRLLYWQERTGVDGQPELVFGPIGSAGNERSRTADYIKGLESDKAQYENGRLLYVGVTRARRFLHLLGHVEESGSHGIKPRKGSMLEDLWPAVEQDYQSLYEQTDVDHQGSLADQQTQPSISYTYLSDDWLRPEPPAGVSLMSVVPESTELDVEFDWAGESARMIGIVVHRLLQQLAVETSGREIDWNLYEGLADRLLISHGIPQNALANARSRVMTALKNCVSDQRGRWILFGRHQDAQCEFPITGVTGSIIRHMIIDRTFIDNEGTRWVIDYKTGSHEGGNLEAFLDREQERYQEQLERYANTMQQLEDRPVRRGLYFPIINAWRAW